MAIESDESEIMFIELPVMNMYTKATSSDMGIVRMIMRVARHLPRKNSTTSITKRAAYISVSVRLLIEPWINSDVSMIFSMRISGGRSFWSFFMSRSTSRHI
ncbi:MAG: hypothetical protein BWY89_01468 [Bacteroidetes bacterium ADurb.BinA012]|nr:MAG: hypothetical protein BWY89_01468 [Bacteroidetes bacterium ADurb.BinA012]